MSYYGVLVLITVLVTSLVAFYLIYKAKELNLGIVISISIGSIILGFTFSPIFDTIMNLLKDNIIINKKIAVIISILILIFVFLLFILVISFIISISIPKKLASIDCCVIVDRIIVKIKIGAGIVYIKDKSAGVFKIVIINIQKTVKNVYNSLNKLKKPVDTMQKIDTMGIEKNENVSLQEESFIIDTPDSLAFANLMGFVEPSVAYENKDSFEDTGSIEQEIKTTENAYENIAATTYEEIVKTEISDIEKNEIELNKNQTNDLPSVIVEEQVLESQSEEVGAIHEVPQIEITELELNQIASSDQNYTIETIEYSEAMVAAVSIIDANSLVIKAFESKGAGRKEEAIECYIEALQHEPNNEMLFWIVLDVCALYKQLGLISLAQNILEGLVSEYGLAINPEIKMEIMNHLK